jgi:hypothetical protein
MIVNLTVSQIQTLIEQINAEITYQHRLNLAGCKIGIDTSAPDAEVVQLLGLCYQLKNVLLVEQTKQAQAEQQARYLTERRNMLLDYLLIITDNDLKNAVQSIQAELQNIVKSTHFDTKIDVEIDESTHTLLASKNIIN